MPHEEPVPGSPRDAARLTYLLLASVTFRAGDGGTVPLAIVMMTILQHSAIPKLHGEVLNDIRVVCTTCEDHEE